ncbi:MAG: hypothetical protein ACOX1G_04270 [bacterium]
MPKLPAILKSRSGISGSAADIDISGRISTIASLIHNADGIASVKGITGIHAENPLSFRQSTGDDMERQPPCRC